MIDAETARGTFVAFARKTGILIPEPVIAARQTKVLGRQVSA
jgi:hypothetical protein